MQWCIRYWWMRGVLLGQKCKKNTWVSVLRTAAWHRRAQKQSSLEWGRGKKTNTQTKPQTKPTAELLWQQRFKFCCSQLLPFRAAAAPDGLRLRHRPAEPYPAPGFTRPRGLGAFAPATAQLWGRTLTEGPPVLLTVPPAQAGRGADCENGGPGRAGPRRGGAGSEPAPAGAAPRPAAPMGWRAGRGAAAAVHVAFSRWRPLRTQLRGRLRGWGRRAAAEGGGRALAALASPRRPAGRGGAFRAAARLRHAAGLEAPQRSGVNNVSRGKSPAAAGGVREGRERLSVRPSRQLRAAAERRLCPRRGLRAASVAGSLPLGRGGQRRRPARPGQSRAPLISPPSPPPPAGRCSPVGGRQGGTGGGTLWRRGGARPPSLLCAAAGRGWPALPRDPPAAGLSRPARGRGAAPPRRALFLEEHTWWGGGLPRP